MIQASIDLVDIKGKDKNTHIHSLPDTEIVRESKNSIIVLIDSNVNNTHTMIVWENNDLDYSRYVKVMCTHS